MSDDLAAETRRIIVRALFNAPPCPDSPEPGRACRYCEADQIMRVLTGADDA